MSVPSSWSTLLAVTLEPAQPGSARLDGAWRGLRQGLVAIGSRCGLAGAELEDAVQDVLFRLVEVPERRRLSRMAGGVEAYLRKVMLHCRCRAWRRRRRLRPLSKDLMERCVDETEVVAERSSCGAILGRLDPTDRQLLLRRYQHGQTLLTLAKTYQASESTMSRRVHRALDKARRDIRRRGVNTARPAPRWGTGLGVQTQS